MPDQSDQPASPRSSAVALYVHEPREDGLSDHSALAAGFTLQPPPSLPVPDLAGASMPATLF